MKKIFLIILVGGVLFFVAAIVRSPQEVLPPPLAKYFSNKRTSCPSPFLFTMPIDLSRVTSILYPGQIRGGNFKAHGGFRFDGSKPDDITVYAPIDARVITGARYPVNDEIQYTFDFEHPCGIRYRLGHLLTLTPKFQALAEKFPLPTTLDSRTTQVSPPIDVKQGEIIATAVGLTKGGPQQLNGYNTFLDWGVYDYRQRNEASQMPDWPTRHALEDSEWGTYYNSEINQYAVCWFDWISAEDKAMVLSLPSSDSQSGKTSDYCK
ncbi:MAG TPA: hypothetical protein VJB96_03855 [Patescibacteria group bacterium]|nr:hypothetical protein [Patescibacteria group bacterium]